MKPRKKLFVLATAVAVLIGTLALFWKDRSKSESMPVAPASTSPLAQPRTVSTLAQPAETEFQDTPDLVLTEDVADEVAATRRMYKAHEPLRAPEISNPDSDGNKQILETMVLKALARTGATSTEPAAANN